MVSFNENDKIFFVSDTHWWHTNIIKYCNRPFDTVEEMNEKLISNWNSVVNKEDTVFHLGDFAFCGPTKAKVILEQLNGNIILVKGNHDYDSILKLFNKVYDQLIIKIGEELIYLNHFPFLTYAGAYRENVYQLFGHVHSCKHSDNIEDEEVKTILEGDIGRLQYLLPRQYDVGVDNNNFTPITWKQIKEINKW